MTPEELQKQIDELRRDFTELRDSRKTTVNWPISKLIVKELQVVNGTMIGQTSGNMILYNSNFAVGGAIVLRDNRISLEADDVDLDNSGYQIYSGEFKYVDDNSAPLGTAAKRFSDVRSVLINGADICLENGWKFREYPATKEDVGKPVEWMKANANKGIQILDNDENLIAVIHQDGYIYCKGTKPLEDL